MPVNFYFICATGTHGGPEAIHQIVDKINNLSSDRAYVAYFQKQFVREEKFKDFNVNYISLDDVPDETNTVICAPETHTYFLRKYKKARKVIVWLSLYHYLRNLKEEQYSFKQRCENLYCKNRFPWPAYPLYYLRDLINKKNHFKFDMENVFHTQNCEYVAAYLREHSVPEDDMIYLDGPVRAEYFEDFNKPEKENTIAYNPSKGAEKYVPAVLEAIKKKDSSVTFVPISGLTVTQVREALCKSKVYLDFGFFPGPEKLVKEAALCGCNIITSDFGAAKNDIDILIPKEYKFNVDENCNEQIAEFTCDMLNNYEKYRPQFLPYVEKVNKLYFGFDDTVKDFIKVFHNN